MRARLAGRLGSVAAVAAALTFAVLALALGVAPVAASCALPPGEQGPRWEDAEIAIVGTVRAVADHDRVATVVVEEIWRGPDLPAEVTIRGGFATGDAFTSGDRMFQVGTRYVFDVVRDEASGDLQDNACSLTAPWSAEMAALRPADARSVAVEASSVADTPDLTGWLGILGVVGVVAVVLLLAAVGIRRLDV